MKSFRSPALAEPTDGKPVAQAMGDMPVDRLIGDVETAVRQAVQLGFGLLPAEAAPEDVVVREIGAGCSLATSCESAAMLMPA